MSHRDPCAGKPRLNFELLKIALLWLLHGVDWTPVHWRSDRTWKSPRLLAVTAFMWSWSDEALVGDRLTTTRKVTLQMFPQTQTAASTIQGFIRLLRHWTDTFVTVLQESLRRRMEQELSDCMRVGKYLLFAVDGSRIDLPRTLSHQRAFSAVRPGKKRKRKETPSCEGGRCQKGYYIFDVDNHSVACGNRIALESAFGTWRQQRTSTLAGDAEQPCQYRPGHRRRRLCGLPVLSGGNFCRPDSRRCGVGCLSSGFLVKPLATNSAGRLPCVE